MTGLFSPRVTTIPQPTPHVRLIARGLLETLHEDHRLVGAASAMRGDDIDERGLDILGHALGVTAHINMGAFVQPLPERRAHFAHAVLHIEFFRSIA